jgi:asparagine synthase (glutamine-hydrolysing)
MSRIAGLLTSAGDPAAARQVAGMLATSRALDAWSSACQPAEGAVLGWCGGREPKIAHRDGISTVMDGSIYNRDELSASGFASDAALLTSLFRKHGFAEALRRINGDFAVAVYDERERTLWLGRDRFGLKPLYYAGDPARLAFASRPKALLGLPGVGPEVNPQFVALFAGSHYRTFDQDPERTPYARVSQVPAGHLLRVADGKLARRAYWTLEDEPDHEDPEEVLVQRYRRLLVDAVALRVKAAHRPAFTLSGGMDSSSVIAAAVHISGARQHVFSSVYVDKTFDESDEIRSMLDATVERWYPVSVGTPDVFGLVARMIEANDEPIATATWLSHYLVCEEAARQGFGGLFGGLGGDELNAGEYEHFIYFFADLRQAGDENRLAEEITKWVEYHDHPVFRKSAAAAEAALARLVDLDVPGRCRPDRGRIERYAAALNPGFFDLRTFEPLMDHPFRSYLKNRTYQDMMRETIPCCLRAEDRQTTAFGLDRFLPFFDHRLVEFMFRVPSSLKYRAGVTKHLLRLATRGLLPEATRTRVKKTGWNAPAHVWWTGANGAALHDLIHSQAFRERGIYNVKEVERLVAEHEEIVTSDRVAENHMMFLWQLVNLELWLRSTLPARRPQY